MTKPIIPWMGGKRRLADKLLPMFPVHQCYVEVFAGAAALFFMKEESKVEVINDINGDLINLYRVVQNHLEEFARQFKYAIVSRQIFEWEKMKKPETLTDIQRAARFFYLQKLCFGGKVSDQNYGYATSAKPRLNLLRIEEDLTAAHLRLARVNVENIDWQELVKRYDREHTFFYLDPPYYKTAGYGVDFGLDQYRQIAEKMASVKGKILLSINDHKKIREVFRGFKISRTELNYTVGGAQQSKTKSGELIIKNW